MQNSEYTNNEIVLHKDGVIYGPYVTLYSGVYKVEISGNNLTVDKYYSCYDMGKKNIDIDTIKVADDKIVYTVKIKDLLKNVEYN